METNFQTSFIPKKPLVPERAVKSRPIGLLTFISIIIFLTAVVAAGALYIYKGVLQNSLTQMQNDLELAKNRFDPSQISQLNTLDRRLSAASTVLGQHISISPIFQALQDVTLKSISYDKFGYTTGSGGNQAVTVQLSGVAADYASVALQSDLFAKDKFFIDPVFSNLSLDNSGKVNFDLQFSVDSGTVNYEKIIDGASSAS